MLPYREKKSQMMFHIVCACFRVRFCVTRDAHYTLVGKTALVPVPEALLYRKTNRYKRFGTKAPPSLVPVSYKPVLKGLHVGSQGVQG
jgi:hypothetical protein